MKQDSIIKNALILCTITLITGLLLGLTYNLTKEPIAEQERLMTEAALQNVLPDAHYNELDVEGDPAFVTAVYQGTTEENGGDTMGYVFQLETTEGYGDSIKLMVGILNDGTLSGIDIVTHSETPGLGEKADKEPFKSQFIGKLAEPLNLVKSGNTEGQNIDAIGGATITSRAVTGAVNDAINYYMTYMKEAN